MHCGGFLVFFLVDNFKKSRLIWFFVHKSGYLWMGFRGVSHCKIDTKGRFAVPVKYRSSLLGESNDCVITIDTHDQCLLLYPTSVWLDIEAKLQSLSSFDPQVRRTQRLLVGHATDCEMDNNGRILLPTVLRAHAGLEKDLVLVGQGKRFEVWNESLWQKKTQVWLTECQESRANDEAIAEQLIELSL